jgi:hypothetical protein
MRLRVNGHIRRTSHANRLQQHVSLDEGVHAVSVTPADESPAADERYVIGVDYGTLSGRALGRQAGTNSDTEHDGIEAVTA